MTLADNELRDLLSRAAAMAAGPWGYASADISAVTRELMADNIALHAAKLTLAADNLRLTRLLEEARAIINDALFFKEDGAAARAFMEKTNG